MAKKKQYSFADEAKQIAKRFPRRENDPIELRDYKLAMNQLMQEQEAARNEMGLDNPDVMACGGKMKYEIGGPMSHLFGESVRSRKVLEDSGVDPSTIYFANNGQPSDRTNMFSPSLTDKILRAGDIATRNTDLAEAGITDKPFFIKSIKKRFDNLDKENVKIYGFITEKTLVLDQTEVLKGSFRDLVQIKKMII